MARKSLRCNLVCCIQCTLQNCCSRVRSISWWRDWKPFVLELNGIGLWIQLTCHETYIYNIYMVSQLLQRGSHRASPSLSFFKMLRMRWLLLGSLSLILYAGIGHWCASLLCELAPTASNSHDCVARFWVQMNPMFVIIGWILSCCELSLCASNTFVADILIHKAQIDNDWYKNIMDWLLYQLHDNHE